MLTVKVVQYVSKKTNAPYTVFEIYAGENLIKTVFATREDLMILNLLKNSK